jgi:Tfp pilus assembly protein PilO
MKALFGMTEEVPLSRVLSDYRVWIVALAVALVASLAVLILIVFPLFASADAATARATRASETLAGARTELEAAEQTRDGSAQAAKDLDRFYGEILPADVAAARRLTHLKLSQMARERNVRFQRSAASPEEIKESSLERLRVSYALAGDYDDIRSLIYDIETAPDFLVIENVFLSEGQDEQAPLTLTLDLSTYFRAAHREP